MRLVDHARHRTARHALREAHLPLDPGHPGIRHLVRIRKAIDVPAVTKPGQPCSTVDRRRHRSDRGRCRIGVGGTGLRNTAGSRDNVRNRQLADITAQQLDVFPVDPAFLAVSIDQDPVQRIAATDRQD